LSAVGSGKALSIERCSSFAYAFFGGFLKWGTSKSFKIGYINGTHILGTLCLRIEAFSGHCTF